jgi:hypothetical protein
MGGSVSVIKHVEDSKNKLDAGGLDLSNACQKDAICPPTKFITSIVNKFSNKYDNDNRNNNGNIKYILILLILLLFLSSIYLLKYI